MPRDVPGSVHHDSEVLVIIDGCGNIIVVLLEFSRSHDRVVLTATEVVVSLESFKELGENLVFSLSTLDNSRMLLS